MLKMNKKECAIDLQLGDCLEVMKTIKDKSIDAVITDPPYNISKKNNFHTMCRAGIDFGEWDKGFDLFSYIDEIPRILSKNGSVVIFNDWKNVGDIARYCESKGLVIKDMLRWEKANPMPRNRDRRYITDYEVAIWCTNKNAKWTFNRLDNKYQRPLFKGALTKKSEKTLHSTQKPLWLMEDIIKIHTNENDTVLDMFMGSGTTMVACKKLNRNGIGIEKEKKYYDISVKRLKECQVKSQLFR